MEQFYYTLEYVEGDTNMLADCFSRLPRIGKTSVGKKELEIIEEQKETVIDIKSIKVPSKNDEDEENFVTTTTSKDWNYNNEQMYSNKDEPELFPTMCTNDNDKMIECRLNLQSYQYNDNPLTMINIANHQQTDGELMQSTQLDPVHFPVKMINNVMIICYREQLTMNDNGWRIVIPQSMIDTVVRWYHLVLGHPGRQRLYDTINARFFYPGLSTICEQYRCPDDCDMIKNQGRQYRHLAAREVNIAP